MSIIVGLTGPTGAGKSTAAGVARDMGIQVIDCDSVARIAVLPGTPGIAALRAAFGEEIICNDGTLDRKSLARTAFSTQEKTFLLNKILLPHIVNIVKSQITENNVLLDAPTLFESGLDSICTATVAVLSKDSTRLERIIDRDFIDADFARLRLNAGKDNNYYTSRADFVIYNDGDLYPFICEINTAFKKIYGG